MTGATSRRAWRATRRAMFATSTVALSIALAGCGVPEVSCEYLASQLLTCDLQPARLRCDDLSAERRALIARDLSEGGCATLRDEVTGQMREDACTAFDWKCPPPLGGDVTPAATRYPLLFVAGIDGRPDFDWNRRILDEVADQTGSEVQHVPLAPWATTEVRAGELRVAVQQQLARGHGRVNLICYAVAGLDCRFLVSPQGLFAHDQTLQQQAAAAVASITTVATPHRGTHVAQAALTATDAGAGTIWGTLLGADAGDGPAGGIGSGVRATLAGLTNEHVTELSERLADAGGIYYQSWAGVSHVAGLPIFPVELAIRQFCIAADGSPRMVRHPDTRDFMSELLWISAPFAGRSLDASGAVIHSPHDGMVSVDSARWGEFRGCIPADHYDVIGQLGDDGADPNTGFDAARFYTDVASDLSARGF